jgi:hypothetical protein
MKEQAKHQWSLVTQAVLHADVEQIAGVLEGQLAPKSSNVMVSKTGRSTGDMVEVHAVTGQDKMGPSG